MRKYAGTLPHHGTQEGGGNGAGQVGVQKVLE